MDKLAKDIDTMANLLLKLINDVAELKLNAEGSNRNGKLDKEKTKKQRLHIQQILNGN